MKPQSTGKRASIAVLATTLAACSVDVIDETGRAPAEEHVGSVDQASVGARFGTWCQQSYQNGWQATLPEAWNTCAWFNNELDDTDQKIFYYDLSNKAYYWHATGDHQPANDSADDVDLLFVGTHGGVTSSDAIYAMWNQGQFAYSSQMRLGDSAWWGGGLAIQATYSCKTLKSNDNLLVTRWANALRGGLKIMLGSHDIVWYGTTTNEVGEDFADNLQSSQAIKMAWRDGLSDWYQDQDVSVVATGTNSSNCWSRMDNMKWQNYGSYPFIRDNSIGYTCWYWWDNI
jgi:hypothetical protein